MLTLAGFAQLVIGAAADHVGAMLDEALDDVDQAEFAGLAMHDRQHDDAEAGLQLRLLVQIVEDDFGLLAALQFEDDAQAVAVAFVADFGNAFDLLLVDQRGGIFDEPRFIHLVGNLGDYNVFAILAPAFDGRLGPQLELPAAFGEGVDDALAAEDEAAGRKIGAGHHLQDFR